MVDVTKITEGLDNHQQLLEKTQSNQLTQQTLSPVTKFRLITNDIVQVIAFHSITGPFTPSHPSKPPRLSAAP